MDYEFNKSFETLSLSPVEYGPNSDVVLRRAPLSRAGSEQASSSTQPRVSYRRQESTDSQSSVSSSLPLSPGASSLTQEGPSRLKELFAPRQEPRICYSDREIQEISRCLRSVGWEAWGDVPRLYTVLRTIDQLHLLDDLLKQGISDVWFPFNSFTVPRALSSSLRTDFLEAQRLVLTKAVDLERTGTMKHTHFGKDDAFPFEIRGELGRGGYATVDKIYSPLTRRELARKRFTRGKGQRKGDIESFKNELQVLKRIRHHHCVELVASYTDSKYFGLIMIPVAHCNLTEFYKEVPDNPRFLDLLRRFYGCLAAGLQYLHGAKIRHRDIKPENILVKGDCVYLTDFGISLDWENMAGGTTTEDTAKTWIYCAPEVAYYEPRNASSDIWSLGCVFFEMTTVLKGRTIDDMREYFEKTSGSNKFFQCKDGIKCWSRDLYLSGLESDSLPLKWIASMMQVKPDCRPSAEVLCTEIGKSAHHQSSVEPQFVGECCAPDSDDSSSAGSALESNDDELASPLTSAQKSPQVTDKSMESPNARPTSSMVGSPVSHDMPDILTSTSEETVIQGHIARPGQPAVEASNLPSSHSPSVNEATLPYPSFSRAHSKEAVGKTTNYPALAASHARKGPREGPREDPAEALGTEAVPHDVLDETPLIPPRIITDNQVAVDGMETDVLVKGRTTLGTETAVETAAALQASKSRRASASSNMPETRITNLAMSPTLEVDTDMGRRSRRASNDMQDLQGWQTIGFRNNLPKLSPLSWTKPSQLLDDVKNEKSFMKFLFSRYRDCYELITGATLEDITALVEMLLRNGLQIDAWTYMDGEGFSPTLSVLDWGEDYQALFKLMVNSGAKLDYETEDRRTLLSQAAGHGYIWAIDILVDAGADLNRHTKRCAIVDAAEYNQLEMVEYLITKLHATPDLKAAEGRTPLRAAAVKGHVEIVRFLLDTCADQLDIENKVNDQTILYEVCVAGNLEVAQLLLAHGADPNISSGVKTGKWTPLHQAAKAGNTEIVRALVAKGAIISNKTLPMISGAGAFGKTAIEQAKKCGHMEIVKFLEAELKTQAIMKRYKSKKDKRRPSKTDDAGVKGKNKIKMMGDEETDGE